MHFIGKRSYLLYYSLSAKIFNDRVRVSMTLTNICDFIEELIIIQREMKAGSS